MARILTVLKKKVLFVDTTITEKTKFIVPTMTPTKKYVTTFDGIDVAIGFSSFNEIKEYMYVAKELDYDYILLDIDDPAKYLSFGIKPTDGHFFVTSFDVYSVQKGVGVLRAIETPTEIMKVLFTRDPESEESEYLNFITLNCKVKWKEDIVYFPYNTEDLYTIFQNQRFSKVRFSGLSNDYIDGMTFLLENLSGLTRGEIKRSMRAIERA
jgi:hypothetical protein